MMKIVARLDAATPKIKYPNRSATRYLDSPYISATMSASDIEMNEQREHIAKHTIVDHITKQMSTDTNTHHASTNYLLCLNIHLQLAQMLIWMIDQRKNDKQCKTQLMLMQKDRRSKQHTMQTHKS